MGLAGGGHCLAMCSAPCAAVTSGGHSSKPVSSVEQPVVWQSRSSRLRWMRSLAFHVGRLVGYASMGALAAWAMESLAWVSQQSMALRPVWTLMHVAVLGWGLMMMVQSRQPAWVERAGRTVWGKVRPLVASPGGAATTGALWALMPCGLLYSALLVAALSGGSAQGALTMAFFAFGSGVWLAGGPLAWRWAQRHLQVLRGEWGARISGGLLCGVAVWALWIDLFYKPSLWCR